MRKSRQEREMQTLVSRLASVRAQQSRTATVTRPVPVQRPNRGAQPAMQDDLRIHPLPPHRRPKVRYSSEWGALLRAELAQQEAAMEIEVAPVVVEDVFEPVEVPHYTRQPTLDDPERTCGRLISTPTFEWGTP